jgi:O-antigen/teichoic acid export membrane protein
VSILALIPTTVSQVVYPIFSDFYANAKGKLTKALSDSFRIIEILAIPIAAGASLLAPKIFALLFPAAFAAGAPVLRIMILGTIIGYANWVLYAFLLAVNRQRFSMILSISVGVFVAVCALVFVPKYGYMALPFIAVATDVTIFLWQVIYLRRIGYARFGAASILKPTAASLLMSVALWVAYTLPVGVLIAGGALIYGAAMLLFGGFGEQEREILHKIQNRFAARRPGVDS